MLNIEVTKNHIDSIYPFRDNIFTYQVEKKL